MKDLTQLMDPKEKRRIRLAKLGIYLSGDAFLSAEHRNYCPLDNSNLLLVKSSIQIPGLNAFYERHICSKCNTAYLMPS
jgi:hypothetical protein